MKIYIDSDYKCHVSNDGTMREFEISKFDGKCKEYIEGHRFVPDGETWQHKNGMVFRGEMTTPWVDSTKLQKAQLEYELAQLKAELADADAALAELGVTVDG